MRSWVIGSSPDCDVVVDSPLASARHCQLTQTAEGFLLNDLASTNGTYVNGVRLAGSRRLKTGDSITLGRTVPFSWPRELTTSIQIGSRAENDIVLDDPRVSGHHARLVFMAGFQTLIEDIGSSNGTFLNSRTRRVTGPTPITESDMLFFGTLPVPAARLLRAPTNPQTPAPTQSHVTAGTELPRGPIVPVPLLAFWQQHRVLLVWLAQTPVIAILIVLLSGGQVGAANWESNARAIAATTFALALAAIWSGCSLAVAEIAVARSPVRQAAVDLASFFVSVGKRLIVLVALCSVACAVLLAVVYWGSGLKGPWQAMCGGLVLTSLVGLFLGFAISALVRNWAAAAGVLLVCFMAMIALGGWIQPAPKMSLPAQFAAQAMPSRWAFEGLFLLEIDHHVAPVTRQETDVTQNHDPVDEFFPANSERMGATADTMALASMLIGLAALAIFLLATRKSFA